MDLDNDPQEPEDPMKDPVIAQVSKTHAKAVERAYAENNGLTIIEDQPLYAHGRLRGPFRIDGRTDKPKANLPKAIPTPKKTTGKPAGGTTDGKSVEDPEESK